MTIGFVQAGISRTTTGMVIAALIKEHQLASELNQMKGIVPDDILEALKKKKLGLPGIDTEAPEGRNKLQMGEFDVILELVEAHPEAKVAKAQVSLRVSHWPFCVTLIMRQVKQSTQASVLARFRRSSEKKGTL